MNDEVNNESADASVRRERLLRWAWIEMGMPWEHEVLESVGRTLGLTRDGVRDAARDLCSAESAPSAKARAFAGEPPAEVDR